MAIHCFKHEFRFDLLWYTLITRLKYLTEDSNTARWPKGLEPLKRRIVDCLSIGWDRRRDLVARKALDNIDLNLVSHRYVSGVLKDDHFVSARSLAFASWSLFDRSSNFNQSTGDSQMHLAVHSLARVPPREIHIRTVLRNSGILFLTVQHLSTFAYDTHGQVKDTRLLKLNVLFMLR